MCPGGAGCAADRKATGSRRTHASPDRIHHAHAARRGLVRRGRDVDITGPWTSSFDTQIGQQNYAYEFVVKDRVLTGTAKNEMGERQISDGKVDG